MNALREEADEAAGKVEELQSKVKQLEQENLAKEQEITSLQHKNGVLEQEVEKLEKLHGDAKAAADESAQHGTQNDALHRKVQLLEEEAEANDKALRETNEKYVTDSRMIWYKRNLANRLILTDSAKPTSKLATMSGKYRRSKLHVISGKPSTRRCPRNTRTRRRSWMTSWQKLVPSKRRPFVGVTPLNLANHRLLTWMLCFGKGSHAIALSTGPSEYLRPT